MLFKNLRIATAIWISVALAIFAATAASVAAQSLQQSVAHWDFIIAGTPDNPDEKVIIGDMVMTLAQLKYLRNELAREAGMPVPKLVARNPFNKWTNGIVYYEFNGNVNATKQKAFLDAAAEWAMFANITFTPRSGQPNYIHVEEDAALNGGLATIGMAGGAGVFKIGPNSWNRNTLCHEIGHTLGIKHEHQRSNRDDYVVIDTVHNTDTSQFALLTVSDSTNVTAYDFLSVMHYAKNLFSTDPQVYNTITPLPAYSQYLNEMGMQDDRCLSKLDRAGIAAPNMYGPSPTPLITQVDNTLVVENTNDCGPGSLRAAIYKAWDTATAETPVTITFNIPVGQRVGGVYPIILSGTMTRPGPYTTIDGTTQPANAGDSTGPRIVLDPTQATSFAIRDGLRLTDNNCTVKGLIIRSFPNSGIIIEGSGSTANTVSGCYIGTNNAGTAASANANYGVRIRNGAHGNTVGGTTAADRNVISGNTFDGVSISGASTTGNVVQGNYIGLNAAGTAAIANASQGVRIENSATGNTIGGEVAGAGNVCSGNTGSGIYVVGANNNVIAGNYVGLNGAGTAVIANGASQSGIAISSSTGTRIGGVLAASRNVCSGNAAYGLSLSTCTNSLVYGNYFGPSAAGALLSGNSFGGLLVSGGSGNVIGGPLAGQRNIIAGNASWGLLITGSAASTTVQGNYFGLNPAGTALLGNGNPSLGIISASNTQIGGTSGGARNVISNGSSVSVYVHAGGVASNITGTKIEGNYIGTDYVGTPLITNDGVNIFGNASNVTVGGSTPGAANLIRGTGGFGVYVDSGSNGVSVSQNSIYGFTSYSMYSPQVAPTITSASVTTGTNIVGSLTGATANSSYRLEFFASPVTTGRAIQYFLGSQTVTTNGSGTFSFNPTAIVLPAIAPVGSIVRGTATLAGTGTTSVASSTSATVTMADADGDGIPNLYETPAGSGNGPHPLELDPDGDGFTTAAEITAGTQPFLSQSNSADAALDSDGDGFTNLQEFRDGTNGANGADRLHINLQWNATSGIAEILLPSKLGRVYNLSRAASVDGSYETLLTNILGTGTTITLKDDASSGVGLYYYKASTTP